MGIVRELRGSKIRLERPALSGGALADIADQYTTRTAGDRDKLERMMRYGQSAGCRWKLLLDYFGEAVAWERCGSCDNCRTPVEQLVAS
jgi:ATP-dependent DNA helicase RecQ